MRTNATLVNATQPTPSIDAPERSLELQCPACGKRIGKLRQQTMTCASCGFTVPNVDGIYRALPPDRKLYFSRFIAEYQTVREQEGRGSTSPDYYLALPFRDLSGRNTWQWTIRARTFAHFEQNLLPKIAALRPDGADILDIGAGNGWLSYRLALNGQRPVAVDLADNSSDGLGAAQHYFEDVEPFPCFQAEMDTLPFADEQFDGVIFNASFHYSTDYKTTLKEALRCLRRPGYLVIADTPLYHRAVSGEQMLEERKEYFRRRFGFSSDSLPSLEYVTPKILSELSQSLSLNWHIEKLWYGLGWAMRPLKAWVLRKREPSKFYLLWARVER